MCRFAVPTSPKLIRVATRLFENWESRCKTNKWTRSTIFQLFVLVPNLLTMGSRSGSRSQKVNWFSCFWSFVLVLKYPAQTSESVFVLIRPYSLLSESSRSMTSSGVSHNFFTIPCAGLGQNDLPCFLLGEMSQRYLWKKMAQYNFILHITEY